MRQAAFILSGLAAGIFSGSLGVGGALLATPLIRFLGVAPYLAIGTTVPVLLPTTLTGAFTYNRAGLIDWRIAFLSAAGGSVGAVGGALTTRVVDGHYLMLLTAALMTVLAIRLFPEPEPARDAQSIPSRRRWRTSGTMAVGAFAGFFSGLLGVGGGFLLVPAFIRWFHLRVKTALGTSLAVISITSIPNAVAQAYVGNIDWEVALLLAIGVIPGAYLGAKIAIRMPERPLRLIIASAVLVVALAYALIEVAALTSR